MKKVSKALIPLLAIVLTVVVAFGGYLGYRMFISTPETIPSCTLTVIDTTKTDVQQMYSFEKVEA